MMRCFPRSTVDRHAFNPRRTNESLRADNLLLVVGCLTLFTLLNFTAIADEKAANLTSSQSTNPVANPKPIADLTQQAEALKQEHYAIGERLLEEFPDNFNALRVMGFIHSSHGNLEKMYACWERCRQLAPDRADIYDQLGRYAVQAEKYNDAIAFWKKVISLDPKFPGVCERIGYAYLNLGETETAREYLKQQLAVSPESAQTHYLMGETLFQLQDFKNAEASYVQAAKLEPTNGKAYYGLIKTYARLGKNEQAAKVARTFQQLEQAAFAADVEYRQKFNDIQQMREKLAVTCVDAGRMFMMNRKAEDAKTLWQRATQVDPNNTHGRSLLATLYSKQRKYLDALKQLEELVRMEPENVNAYVQIGFLQARLEKLSDAEATFKKIINLHPKKSIGYRSLAKFYLNTKQNAVAARNLAIQAVKLEPTADSFFTLGWASATSGKREEAVASLKKAIELNPNDSNYRKLYEAVEKSK